MEDFDERPGWHAYFLGIARAVSRRADCTRRQVGAVVVSGKRIRSTGYNGAAAGKPSCLGGHCPRGRLGQSDVPSGSSYDTGRGACIALHAEQNALLYADRSSIEGGTLYVTCPPCEGCMRMIEGSGIAQVVYVEDDGETITIVTIA